VAPSRIGLFGGTFDPPHLGHVAALRAAANTGRFDRIEVMVAGDPYHKTSTRLVRAAPERFHLAEVAFAGLPLVHVSDLELHRTGPSYTIDTVLSLRAEGAKVDLLVGADTAQHLAQWYRADELATVVTVGVFPRPGSSPRPPEGFQWYEIPMDLVDLSSTTVRARLGDDDDIEDLVPSQIVPLLEGVVE